MRRVMLLALSVLMVVSMAVSPALAHGDGRDGHRHDGHRHNIGDACFVVVFVPFGFWDLDWFGNWFWRDLSRFECR